MSKISRRNFCYQSTLSLGALGLAQMPLSALASNDDDHFYLQIVINGGWDPTYLLDARPLQMTQDQWIQNYNGTDPKPFVGNNGEKSLVANSASVLEPLKDYFSVVNGVLMATAFEGHGQNMNFLFSGNPFGGSSFVPWLGERSSLTPTPITGILAGFIFAQVNNHGSMIPLAGGAGSRIVKLLKNTPEVDLNNDLFKFIKERYLKNSLGNGRFSKANQELLESLKKQKPLADKLKTINFANTSNDDAGTIDLLNNLFRKKIARVALMTVDIPNGIVDTHDPVSAAQQPELYSEISQRIATIINLLRSTKYDNNRSLYDVTTFTVCSEFTRTMRQKGLSMDKSGTDHNPLNASFLIGGKKIKCGQVIGSTDFKTSTEVLSQAHLELDKEKLKIMGAPFDFKTMSPSGLKPNEFDVDQYLSMPNLANTMMSVFGVDPINHWTTGRLKPPAPIISSLLK